MRCTNCGIENRQGAAFCKNCGCRLGNNQISSATMPLSAPPAKKKYVKTVIVVIAIVIGLALVVAAIYVVNNGGFSSVFSSFGKSDEEIILGSWSSADENALGAIQNITFLSDGTCTVSGAYGSEVGKWSIVDGQLSVLGNIGGMFISYKGFICPYSLDGSVLTLYVNNNEYTYYSN